MSIKTLVISSVLGLSALSAACGGGATAMLDANKNTAMPTPFANKNTATPTPVVSKPDAGEAKFEASEIKEVSIETVYKEFYEEGSKCRKDYVEYFGKEDGAASSSSPCRIKIVLNRDTLKATRTIEVWRWDKNARQNKSVEKNVWTTELSAEKFDQMAKIVGENKMFIDWQDVMINVSNCTITAIYPQGKRSVMSNVGPTATTYLPMVKAFQEFDREAKWQQSVK